MKNLKISVFAILFGVLFGSAHQARALDVGDLILAGDIVVMFAFDLFGGGKASAMDHDPAALREKLLAANVGDDVKLAGQELIQLTEGIFGFVNVQTLGTTQLIARMVSQSNVNNMSDSQEIGRIAESANIHGLSQAAMVKAVEQVVELVKVK